MVIIPPFVASDSLHSLPAHGEHGTITIYNRLIAFDANLFPARPKFDHIAMNMAGFDPSRGVPISSTLRDWKRSDGVQSFTRHQHIHCGGGAKFQRRNQEAIHENLGFGFSDPHSYALRLARLSRLQEVLVQLSQDADDR
jgi:hypothetical protein